MKYNYDTETYMNNELLLISGQINQNVPTSRVFLTLNILSSRFPLKNHKPL